MSTNRMAVHVAAKREGLLAGAAVKFHQAELDS